MCLQLTRRHAAPVTREKPSAYMHVISQVCTWGEQLHLRLRMRSATSCTASKANSGQLPSARTCRTAFSAGPDTCSSLHAPQQRGSRDDHRISSIAPTTGSTWDSADGNCACRAQCASCIPLTQVGFPAANAQT